MSRTGIALAAVVLAGGRGTRLGGRDKAELRLGGERLVDRAAAAVRAVGADPVVVVGPERAAVPGCVIVREDPPFAGPLAALEAALVALEGVADDAWALLLSCDLVRPDAVVARLALHDGAPMDADAVVLRDPEGRAQWLAAGYRLGALRTALAPLAGRTANAALRRVFESVAVGFVDVDAAVVVDVDTPEDLERAERSVRPESPETEERT
ncbi:molybdenum cofactor guanylyltransferase [Leucobacter iarius]|uniref:Molybdenum cofactor guanylyltransferase n=1 Tax=Leucobacter iarius TaxID=333963 RepID=A0ABN2LGA8_9MICO